VTDAIGSSTAELRQQQQAFESAVLGQDMTGLLRTAPGGAAAALEVYRHAYTARLTSALRDNFEILALALGDEGFDALAGAYIAAHPSAQPSIRWFGHGLAPFMDASVDADDGLVPHPALADLARLDWALRTAFDAADAPVIAHDTLATVAPEHWPDLVLQLHPSVQLLPLQWAVGPAWHALRAASDNPDAAPELPAPEPLPHCLLVWRRGWDTQWRSLDAAEAGLLQAVARGEDFGALCAHAAIEVALTEQTVPQVVAVLQQWLADGLLIGVRG
jgi:hypothetical protein